MDRYALYSERAEMEEFFMAESGSESLFKKRYNILPGQRIPVIIRDGKKNQILSAVWGISAGKNSEHLTSLEQIRSSEEYQNLLEESPCLIPINGFYKWKERVQDDNYPFFIRLISEDISAVAGVCRKETLKGDAERLTCSALTMPANPLITPLSTHMPVLLTSDEARKWLQGSAPEMVKQGFDGDRFLTDMTVFRVPELVNDPSNDSPELIQPIPKLRDED